MGKFLMADRFLELLGSQRLCWWRGPWRTGKTCCVVAIAHYYMMTKAVDRCVANFPVRFATPPFAPYFRTCVMYDEPGSAGFDSRNFANNDTASLTDFTGKFQNMLLLSGKTTPDVRLRSFFVETVMRPSKFLWVYKYGEELGYDVTGGIFALWRPFDYWMMYDHLFPTMGHLGVLYGLQATMGWALDDQTANPNDPNFGTDCALPLEAYRHLWKVDPRDGVFKPSEKDYAERFECRGGGKTKGKPISSRPDDTWIQSSAGVSEVVRQGGTCYPG